ncbi:bifunctional RNase H/acid phosphatase, partial [Nocardioides sp.]|uniref:bifunctional RNase H/acid phosphatase n=1 Tax=Nocardioides sp. TaxID=35761 RepID=UPI0027365CCE
RVVVEADGASRGNPGPAAYGAVLRDADSGRVIAEAGAVIGTATNNVAEYSGLVAGLELVAAHTPDAEVEVRLDSQLVVEQMSGRWRIKHPDLRPLAEAARRLAPQDTAFTRVPRAENGHADRLANEALDGDGDDAGERLAGAGLQTQTRARGWSAPGTPTTLILVRHGVTAHTVDKRFSGGLGGANPGLSDEGRDQVRATAQWLAPMAEEVDLLITSPVRRTRESAEIVAELLGREPEVEPGFAEMEFGAWDGLTFAEVAERHADDLDAWLGSLDHRPGGGESFRSVEKRVLAARDGLLAAHSGRTVVVVSHVTPIKTLVADAIGAPLDSLYRMELAPASVSVVSYFEGTPERPGTIGSLRLFNARPVETAFLPR